MLPTQTILVTGANGQLGSELRVLSSFYPAYKFIFVTREELPVDNIDAVKEYFKKHIIDYCINCAAYTAVDKAETEREAAFLINAAAVGNLSKITKIHGAKFIHVSTDYVFDGTATTAYTEDNPVHPVNTYGASKLRGEELALQNNPDTIIIRTSWVYSSFGNNFVKTMLRLMKERPGINVVDDQLGCPTYAADLAGAIMQVIKQYPLTRIQHPIFNYCNAGVISWFEFAVAIKEFTGSNCVVNPIPTSQYPTPAKRPKFSVLNTDKIQQTFELTIPSWKESLQKCLLLLVNA